MSDQDFDISNNTPWTSIDLYYKGFHIKKSYPEHIPASTLISDISDYISQGFEPSWNSETNKANDPIMKATEGQGKQYTCNVCGADAELKSGVSKTGKAWKGIFCKDNKDHVQWIR